MGRPLKFETMALSDLTPAAYNPREISDMAMMGLESSIKRFGLVEPIIYNQQTGNVVGGHQRLKVLIGQGVETTDVVVVDLPEIEEKALNVALNNQLIAGDFTKELEAIQAELADDLDMRGPAVLLRIPEIEIDPPEIVLPTGEPQKEPQLKSDCLVEIYCTKAGLATIQDTLNEWAGLDGVEINIS